MAIISQHTAPNFAVGNYHRILRVEILCSPNEIIPRYHIMVGLYASAEARDAYTDPMYVHNLDIPFKDGVEDPRGYLYELISKTELFAGMEHEHDAVPKVIAEPEPEPVAPTLSYAPQSVVPIKDAVA